MAPRAASFPINCCTPFRVVGAWKSIIALSSTGLAFIPLRVTIKPKNLLELTLNAHLKSFVSCHTFARAQRFLIDVSRDWGVLWT